MEKTVKIMYKGLNERKVQIGTTLKELSEYYKKDFHYDILISKVDNDTVELSDIITRQCNVRFYDRSTTLGRFTYASSATFMLLLAIKSVLGEEAKLYVEHSLDNGIYCEIENAKVDKKVIKNIEDEMYHISSENLEFEKINVARTDAMKYFASKGQYDKVNVLKYISNTYINLYKLDNVYDYFYIKLAYSTKQINDFRLNYIKNNGFVLSIPNLENPECTLDYVHHEKIRDAFYKASVVASAMGAEYASDINRKISKAATTEMILTSEAYYEDQLQDTADKIIKSGNIKLVLLAGPSSSGKTTTSKKLMTFLKSRGKGVLQISCDNYFVDRDKTPKDAKGEYDFESLYALDLELFNKQLMDLVDGKQVQLPTYNFITGKREYHNNYVSLGENDIMIIEGIHALNEKMSMSIDKKQKFKIYICPLINTGIDEHNHIHTTDVRKLRRIVRDSKTRGKGARETLAMWSSIRNGEEKNIYPFQDEADVVINSSLFYEIGVLKTYVEPLLFSVDEEDDVYPEALRLINFLRNFLPIPSDDVPIDSVLREFIGGSCFSD